MSGNRVKEFITKFKELAQGDDPKAMFDLYKEHGYDIYHMNITSLINGIMSPYISHVIREEVFMKIYENQFPFDKELKNYQGVYIKALSQKGDTCASDTLFTILFESDALRPYFYTPDWANLAKESVKFPHDPEKCVLLPELEENLKVNIPGFEAPEAHSASRQKYSTVLYNAKYRFERMKSINNRGPLEVPRSSSVSNNLWMRAHTPLTKEGEGGLFVADEALFLGNLLVRNILDIPGFPLFAVQYVQRYKPMPSSVTKENLVAFTLGLVKMTQISEDEVMPLQHAVGFFKKDGKWVLIDNEVGYLHEFQDQDWFENIFLKRLFFTNEHPDAKSGGDPSEKVYIQLNYDLLPQNLIMHFVTLGARSYPNVEFNSSELPFEDSDVNFKINGIMVITQAAGAAGSTGGGSAVATVGGARKRRNQTGKRRRARKQTRRHKN